MGNLTKAGAAHRYSRTPGRVLEEAKWSMENSAEKNANDTGGIQNRGEMQNNTNPEQHRAEAQSNIYMDQYLLSMHLNGQFYLASPELGGGGGGAATVHHITTAYVQ